MIFLTVKGDPIPQARPRLLKNGRVYNAQHKELAETKRNIIDQLSYIQDFETAQQAVSVAMIFYTEITDKSKDQIEGNYDTRRGDIDNFAKFYLDAMNGTVYRDDSLVCKLLCAKVFSKDPRTEIIIKQLEKKYEET